MELLKLTFENLNSLSGHWEIDFTRPEYRSEGIFAIIGPTGAGKSTILDAICLALYGKTPRLSSITSGGNEIMSQQTGHCSAEVTFRARGGVFRATFRQNRAHGKPDGNLQEAKRTFARVTKEATAEAEILGEKHKDVDTLVAEHVGLDFTQFTRAVMLAQGKFAEFLQAPPGDRGSILEKLTKTEIYSNISIAVHRRHKDESDALRYLEAGLAKISFFSPEEMAEYLEQQKTLDADCEKFAAELKTLAEQLAWHARIVALEALRGQMEAEQKTLDARAQQIKPLEEKRRRGELAGKIQQPYFESCQAQRVLDDLRKEHRAASEKLAAEEAQLALTTDARRQLEHKLAETAADAQLAQAVPAMHERAKHYAAMLDTLLARQKTLTKLVREQEKSAGELTQAEADVQRKHDENTEAAAKKTALDAARETLLAGREAETILAEMEEAGNARRGVDELEKHLTAFADDLAENLRLAEKITERQRQCEELAASVKDAEEKEKAQQQCVQTLKAELLRKQVVQSLDEHRKSLHPGQACPLCGATEHPWGEAADVPDITHAQQQSAAAEKTLDELRKRAENDRRQEALTAQSLEKDRESLAVNHRKLAASVTVLAAMYETFGGTFFLPDAADIPDIPQAVRRLEAEKTWAEEMRAQLTTKAAELKKTLDALRTQDKKIKDAAQHVEACRNAWWGAQQALAQKKTAATKADTQRAAEAQNLEADTRAAQRLRQELAQSTKACGEEVPAEPLQAENAEQFSVYAQSEKRVWTAILETLHKRQTAYADAEKELKKTEKILVRQQATVQTMRDNTDANAMKIAAADSAWQLARQAWDAVLEASDFQSENDFLLARLAPETLQELERECETFNKAKIDLAVRRRENESTLLAEREKSLTEKPAEILRQEEKQKSSDHAKILREQGNLGEKIRNSREQEARFCEENRKREIQREQVARWDRLDKLIGSNDGKKFKNFAQGLTFAALLRHANHHLRQMTPRYVLYPEEKLEPGTDERTLTMEIAVQDNDHGGVIRSAKNLSGGETFLVSLALALGLAGMAGKEVQLDSLFLDEGFGTLDEETLDITLHALGTLQQTGKLIGVISHVSALRERLSTQITVRPTAAGRSELTGPGVKRK